MEEAVKDYEKTFISTGRAVGELNHPTSTDVDLKNACHKILSLEQDGNTWIGESQVLVGTPNGDLLAGLLKNNVQVGISTRGVGNVTESKIVDEYKLITADVVYDPSGPGCFMEGILESKNFMINEHGDIVEAAYVELEKSLEILPRRSELEKQKLIHSISNFLRQI